jgi:hypothetical protein
MTIQSLVIVCSLSCGGLVAQEVQTFNVVHQNLMQGPAAGLSVKEAEGGYLVFSVQRGLSGAPQDPFVSLYDVEGELVWEHDYVITRNGFLGYPDPVCRTPNGGFASGVSVFGQGSDIDSLFLWRFNALGDTVATRFLMADTTMTIRKCIRTMNGDYVLTGLHEYPREQYLLRTDSLGTIKDYFGFANYNGRGVAEDALGNFYLTGYRMTDDKGSLIKCDSTGNLAWVRIHGTQGTTAEWRTPLVLADSSVLVVGGRSVVPVGYNTAIVSRYSPAGDLLWTDDAVQSSGYGYMAQFTDAFQKPDGTVVTAGMYEWQGICFCGFVQGYSLDGDPLWRGSFTYYDSLGGGDHYIWDVEPTSDGGMILTGEADYDYQEGSPANLWLVKLDSMGCVVPGCQSLGIHEQYTNLGGALRVWPNPVHGQLHVAISLPPKYIASGEQHLVIVAADGAVVRQQRVPTSSPNDVVMDVQGLSAGTYTVHLTDGRRWLAGSKVIVE